MSKQTMLNASAMAALCALALFSLNAKAQNQDQNQERRRAEQASQQGMVAVRDAQTGKMRAPTADELKALRGRAPAAAAAGRAAPTPQPQALAPRRDGARGVRLGEKSMVYEVVTLGADGKLNGECLHGKAAASGALDAVSASPSNPAAAVEHKEHAHEVR